jgi:hypothetical protein
MTAAAANHQSRAVVKEDVGARPRRIDELYLERGALGKGCQILRVAQDDRA